MTHTLYLQDFLKTHTVEDVLKPVVGELNTHSTDLATYMFGNGELIVLPADDTQDELCFVVDDIGSGPKLVLY